MIALVYRQGTLRVYRNGQFYAEYQGEPRRSLEILRITMGQIIWPEGTDAINHFVGSIDEMRLYGSRSVHSKWRHSGPDGSKCRNRWLPGPLRIRQLTM